MRWRIYWLGLYFAKPLMTALTASSSPSLTRWWRQYKMQMKRKKDGQRLKITQSNSAPQSPNVGGGSCLMTDVPYLTSVRWHCLQAFKRQPALMRRPFLAKELKIQARWNDAVLRPATGPTLSGLEKAGWVRRAIWGLPGTGMPFRTGGPISGWELTDAGREAIAACPDTFPGEPVYDGKNNDD